jgi:DNA-binding ferritin-like protein (Dps family)
MTPKYLNTNPIAKMMALETLRIFENESVDELMQKISTSLFDIFKKVTVDFSTPKQRKMSTVKEKLKDTANSSSLKSMVAKMKDYAKESELEHSSFADVKSLYIDGMEQLADSLKRSVEVDPKLEDKIIKYFQSRTTRYVNALEQAHKKEKEALNESVQMGLKGRVSYLKNKLQNVLIPGSVGKTDDNGYGRNWHRIFSEIDQKLSVINGNKEISNEKEKKALKDLESQTDKLAKEFYTYCIKATEAPFKKILSDDEIYSKFEDVKEILSGALDVLTRATVEEASIEDQNREKMEGYDKKITSMVFPIKVGDKDTDKKFKESLIIANVQKALMNAFPPVKELLIKRGGADGKFTSAFEVAIKSLQGVLGNKNVSGELDRNLLDIILDADKISNSDKEAIADSLDILRKEYVNESTEFTKGKSVDVRILNSSQFFGLVNESSIHIDADKLSAEVEKHEKELSEPETSKGGRSALGYGDNSDNTDLAYTLAKILRSKGFVKDAEEETFLREDGSLRASYTPEFMNGWIKTAEEADKNDLPLYFWVDFKGSKIDGLYASRRLSTSAKKPCNWPKWSEIAGDTDSEDVKNFSEWYTSYYSNFGGIDTDSLTSLGKSIFGYNREEQDENSKVYDRLYSYFGTKEYKTNYVPSNVLDSIKSAFRRGSQADEKIQDLTESDFGLLANLIAFNATTFTFDNKKDKFIPVLEIIMDEILTEGELKKLSSEEILVSDEPSPDQVAILDTKKGIRKANKQDKESGESRNKSVFEQNLKEAKTHHLPIVQKQVARMNAKTSDDLSRGESKRIYKVPTE